MRRLLAVLFLISSPALAAEDCAPLRLDAPGKSMAEMPVYSQNDVGLCYSITAAQMLDAYRFSHGDNRRAHRTSPLALAARFQKEKIAAAVEKNGGLYKLTPENLFSEEPLGVYPVDSYLGYLENGTIKSLLDSMRDPLTGKTQSCNDEVVKRYIRESKDVKNLVELWKAPRNVPRTGALSSQAASLCEALAPDSPARMGAALEAAAIKTNLPDFIQTFIQGSCDKSTLNVAMPVPSRVARHQGDRDSEALKRSLHAALDLKNPQPAGISYCSSVYFDKNSSLLDPKRPCGLDHGSVVIGRRKTPQGKCEFLVRNSWGPYCHYGTLYDGQNCEKGQYWIEENRLADNLVFVDLLLDDEAKTEFLRKSPGRPGLENGK